MTEPNNPVVERALTAFNLLRESQSKPALTAPQMLARLGGDSGVVIEEFEELYGQEAEDINEGYGPFTWRFLNVETSRYGWIYVISLTGKLRLALDYHPQNRPAGAGHKDLAGNGKVLAAGEILLNDQGDIVWIDNQSGHFEPRGESPMQVVRATFERKGWLGIQAVYHEITPGAMCPTCNEIHAAGRDSLPDRAAKSRLARQLGRSVPKPAGATSYPAADNEDSE
ncbi:hypothetical protein GCM10009682_31420 [Luedemannella flava]|uniref:Uncharacterized protein n=1 Tax=Luedemannella flava TaxID=349316 RepID=A0ABP4Y9Q1_9ACTN